MRTFGIFAIALAWGAVWGWVYYQLCVHVHWTVAVVVGAIWVDIVLLRRRAKALERRPR